MIKNICGIHSYIFNEVGFCLVVGGVLSSGVLSCGVLSVWGFCPVGFCLYTINHTCDG